jgi:hypothetical protein
MGIQESNSLLSHLLQMRRFYFAVRIGGLQVTYPKIIRHDKNDIG